MKEIDTKTLRLLKTHSGSLTKQQYKTLRGQVLAGDRDAAMRGLQTILGRGGRCEPRNQATKQNHRCAM